MPTKKRKCRRNPRRDAWWGIGVSGVLMLAFGTAAVCDSHNMWQSYEALQWKACPVQKVEKKVKSSHGRRGGGTSTSWVCHYTYRGVAYKTNEKGCGEFDSGRSTRQLKKWQVYVNPANPSEAVMSRGVSVWQWIGLAVLVLVTLALAVVFALMVRFYRRNFAGQPVKAEKKVRADVAGPRVCKWDCYGSPEELLNALSGSSEVATVENVQDEADGVQVVALKGGRFQLCTGRDAEWTEVLASPEMSRDEVLRWMRDYRDGESIRVLTQGWQVL